MCRTKRVTKGKCLPLCTADYTSEKYGDQTEQFVHKIYEAYFVHFNDDDDYGSCNFIYFLALVFSSKGSHQIYIQQYYLWLRNKKYRKRMVA